jgi:hypothetical protein
LYDKKAAFKFGRETALQAWVLDADVRSPWHDRNCFSERS